MAVHLYQLPVVFPMQHQQHASQSVMYTYPYLKAFGIRIEQERLIGYQTSPSIMCFLMEALWTDFQGWLWLWSSITRLWDSSLALLQSCQIFSIKTAIVEKLLNFWRFLRALKITRELGTVVKSAASLPGFVTELPDILIKTPQFLAFSSNLQLRALKKTREQW